MSKMVSIKMQDGNLAGAMPEGIKKNILNEIMKYLRYKCYCEIFNLPILTISEWSINGRLTGKQWHQRKQMPSWYKNSLNKKVH